MLYVKHQARLLEVCRTYEKSTRQLLLRCSTSCIHAVVRGRDYGPKQPDLSLHSFHYATINHAIFDFFKAIARHSRLLLLAAITLSPTDLYVQNQAEYGS